VRLEWFALALCLTLAGCGEGRLKTYPVSGTIAFADGKPVQSGTVELESIEHGTTATGTIRQDGSFVLGTFTSDDGAAAGRHRAIVVQLIVEDGGIAHTIDHGPPVDLRYGSYETSDLIVEIRPEDDNEIHLTLDAGADASSR
jgi:hypothetical protein